MNLKAAFGISIVVLLLGITSTSYHNAHALDTKDTIILKKDLRVIMDNYKANIDKAKAELLLSIKKANSDAKQAVLKGVLPMDEINAATKATIAKAREDLKLNIQNAKAEAKAALLELKAAVDKNNSS